MYCTGWLCLWFENAKVGLEQLIPLSARAAETIRAQQDHVRSNWPDGLPWLFPGIMDNDDGNKPYAHGSLSQQLGDWQKAVDVRDEAGQRVHVHAHQFRHTVGTRLKHQRPPARHPATARSDTWDINDIGDERVEALPAHPALRKAGRLLAKHLEADVI